MIRTNSRSDQIPKCFNTEQEEFFTGLMLGDGGLTWGKTSGFARLCVTRQTSDKDYLFWQYNVFKDFYGTEPKYFTAFHNRVKKTYDGYAARTRSGSIFNQKYEIWYPAPEYKKRIPKDLKLTPLILLIWFLDDGCVVHSSKNSLILKLSTDGFLEEDVKYLCTLLSNFINDKILIYKNGKGFILRATTIAAVKIIKIIDPIFPSFMERKRTWKNYDFDYLERNQNCFGEGYGASDETCQLLSYIQSGEKSSNAKLTWEQVNNIRNLYINNNLDVKNIYLKYGVCKTTINLIKNNKTWVDKNYIVPQKEKNIQPLPKLPKNLIIKKDNNSNKNETILLNNKCKIILDKFLLEGFTQKQLSEILNVSKRTINKITLNYIINNKTINKILNNVPNINNFKGIRQRSRFSENVSIDLNEKIIKIYLLNKFTKVEIAKMFNISKAKLQRIIYKFKNGK